MGVSSALAAIARDKTSDDQGPWRQYILDHLDFIARRSKRYDIDGLVMNQYRYNLAHYLKENMKRRQDMAWIVQLLNDIPNDFHFVDQAVYIIPSDELINQLYHQFRTITNR